MPCWAWQRATLKRPAGWDVRDDLSDDDLRTMLAVPGQQRPVLLPEARMTEFRMRYPQSPEAKVSRRTIGLATWLMPGPFKACGLE